MRRQLFLFRHGETQWNAEKRIQGSSDIPLNEKGKLQAEGLSHQIQKYSIEAVLSSDLKRAEETGQIVCKKLNIPLFTDERLREVSLGEAEGCALDEITKRFGDSAWDRWLSTHKTDLDFRFPKGESRGEALLRSKSALLDFLKQTSFASIGIATHGGIIRGLIGDSLEQTSPKLLIANCAIHLIYWEEDTFTYVPL